MATMSSATEYVHTHVINYEPTYLVLVQAGNDYAAGGDVVTAANAVQDVTGNNLAAMGLDREDFEDSDVSWIDMVLFEVDS